MGVWAVASETAAATNNSGVKIDRLAPTRVASLSLSWPQTQNRTREHVKTRKKFDYSAEKLKRDHDKELFFTLADATGGCESKTGALPNAPRTNLNNLFAMNMNTDFSFFSVICHFLFTLYPSAACAYSGIHKKI